MPKVILISGKQGSGKTTLQTNLYLRFSEENTADILNFADIIYDIHDFALEELEKAGIKRDIVKDGPLLQLLGTEWGRNTIDKNIWVKALQGKVKNSSADFVIIGDTRFENEFDGFPDAIKIRLECVEEIRKERCSQWRDRTDHPSETGLDEYALSGAFDLYIDTGKKSANQALETVVRFIRE